MNLTHKNFTADSSYNLSSLWQTPPLKTVRKAAKLLKQHLSIELQKQIKKLQKANEAAGKEWQAKIEINVFTNLDKFRQISTKCDKYNVASIKYLFKYTDA